MANSTSCGNRSLKQTAAVPLPAIRIEAREGRCGWAMLSRRRYAIQAGVTAVLIVKHLVSLQACVSIALIPEPASVQILAPDGAD